MTDSIKTLALACALAASLAGCSTTVQKSSAEPVVLENTNWMLPLPEKSDCDTPPVLEFLSGNRLVGDLGCNRASGTFQFDGHNILFDKVATTRRMCGPQFMKLEEQMLNLLSRARTVAKTEKGLTFYDADGKEVGTLVPEVAGACY